MPEAGNLGQLKTQEWQRLQELADQLERDLAEADSVDLAHLLPPPGAPQRLVYLHELIKTEMEIRCRRHKTVALEEYLTRYPELGPADTLPVELIYEEFRSRHRHGDKPPLELYQQRFPAQFEQLRQLEKKDPVTTLYGTALPKTAPLSAGTHPEQNANHSSNLAETLPPAPPLPTPMPPRPATPTPSSNPSQVLPPGEGYQLLERIGRGQFGEVYRGLAPGGVIVAIKRILRSIDDDSCQRELKALEKIRELNHPYLLQTHKYSAQEDRLVIVMELADGSLRDRFKECQAAGLSGIPVDELLRYFGEAAEALDYLREQKLSHRDIKPENLLRLKGHAKVADFGVARHQENTIDQTMNVAGTAAYMPPEMWRGEISLHSDQYSFAATWYEMRTGRRIFSGKMQVQIAQQHMSEPPELSGVPLAEQKVLLRALAKKPEQRYPDCKSFVQALAAANAPPPPPPPVAPRARTTLLLTGALIVVASVLLAVFGKIFLTTPPTTSQPPPPQRWLPTGWQADSPTDTDTDWNGVTYYQRLVKTTKDGEKVVMVLVPQEGPNDPKTFYIMENKVWNKLFQEFAANPEAKRKMKLYGDRNPGTIQGKWVQGGSAPTAAVTAWFLGRAWGGLVAAEVLQSNWESLGVGPGRERIPVFRVTVMEAYFFAEWLGGKLPTRDEWMKAAGVKDLSTPAADEDTTGPFIGSVNDPKDIGLLLGKTGPLPVGTAERDRSRFHCRDMAGNGQEWTRSVVSADHQKLPLDNDLIAKASIYTVGESYILQSRPLTYAKMRRRKPALEYGAVSPVTSFRVVLEP